MALILEYQGYYSTGYFDNYWPHAFFAAGAATLRQGDLPTGIPVSNDDIIGGGITEDDDGNPRFLGDTASFTTDTPDSNVNRVL